MTLTGTDVARKREEIRDYFHKTFDLFESLFELLSDDAVFYRRSEPTRHPMIFYFGHTAAFFINKLLLAKAINARIHPGFESLFAIGVDEMAWDDMEEAHYRWPAVSEAQAYRDAVRARVDELISTLPLTLPIRQEDPFWVILMGIEHERIHVETSSVLHRQMPLECVRPSETFLACEDHAAAPTNALIAVDAGRVRLGRDHGGRFFGWDNEYGGEEVDVAAFEAAKHLVSNGEFMPFVLDGGYDDARYWDEEGAAFLARAEAKHPVFWVDRGDGVFAYRALAHETAMPMNWPVEVNCLEARAFCRWKSARDGRAYRLPTEAEWYRLYQAAGDDALLFDDAKANLNFCHFASSCPVDRFAMGDFFDVVGNVWQWTETPIDAYPGFETHPAYDDFSTPTFDGKHNLIKGGSWASTGNEITARSRYAFRRHFYQHAGFRYLVGEAIELTEENIYESDALVSQYCEFQYGEARFDVPNFAIQCAALATQYAKNKNTALDLGCATGRATFELAKHFDAVTGVDFSARFIQVAVELQKKGAIRYQRAEEGVLTSSQEHSISALGLEGLAEKVQFWQGDACNLKAQFSGYDLILATNLIDRLYEPRAFLDALHLRINDGGVLVLTSPYTWLDEYTHRDQWLGGFLDANGEPVHTFDTLKDILGVHFELIEARDIDFVIRETPRKFQHTVAQMTAWKKR